MTEKLVTAQAADRPPSSRTANQSLAALARHTLKARAAIAGLFPDELFLESAWDIMLELFVARAEGKPLCIKDLVAISRGSPTSTLRRIDRMEASGLMQRRLDPRDHRRVTADLTEHGHTVMVLLLEQLYGPAGNERGGPTGFSPA
ncbi:MarR family winged helix-turn-helix transcriptional regulator [Sphingomonas turrisvirgatae]|uniref:HTH marR-type domain-containing protein n=1 Tax=Sphingomonas turrisvirgatae TaxID=1888892 RepID=A0A1E3LWJ7_9SPHN|nr:MarR family winged helix-turn-helix transcriptional regulator [Sphingomonas turrisvirgatae]ODP38119.1 hypothetical protein BFL28_15445 [Sphingomonas turrisvirgatae]